MNMTRCMMYPLLLAATLAVAGPQVFAAERMAPAVANAAPLTWSELNPAQQDLLQKFAPDWEQLPAARQRALARGAARWLGMRDDERTNAQARFRDWQSLPADRREFIRQRWEYFQSLDPDQQEKIRASFKAYQQLPAAKRAQLRQEWLKADRAKRARMLQQSRQRRLERAR